MASYILMLQTDAEDRFLTESVLAETEVNVALKFLDQLSRLDEFVAGEGLPAVILINDTGTAQRRTGKSVSALRDDPRYSHIPVIVLGERTAPEYIRECYRAGACTFITKPSTVAETRKKIDMFFRYWLEVAEV